MIDKPGLNQHVSIPQWKYTCLKVRYITFEISKINHTPRGKCTFLYDHIQGYAVMGFWMCRSSSSRHLKKLLKFYQTC
ncbi:hypothetical protein BDV35DRAFT_336772 [Aspergillus flavus]|uniref:Uncharacterized protein n=1 Tax=Aspergillus flavus TaxID=5059 RepID=A0A5N6HC36_ASPFL|nr:hypothetical protein BDV35DRAFT_336772 [Aspergillus flavus]